MGQFGIGQPVRRLEDQRFVSGRGRFLDDIALPRQAYAAVLRSPHAHAEIRAIDVKAARKAVGVLLVLTAGDLDDVGPIPCVGAIKNSDGSPMAEPPRPALARGRVRHVGDPLAFVVAETVAAAQDAAELIAVEYEPLPAVIDPEAALEPNAPRLFDEAPGNLCFDWENGDAKAVDAAFARAAHVTRLSLINNRIVVASMEPRGAIAEYDAGEDRYTLYASTQGSHGIRDSLAEHALRQPAERIRVVTPDVGGAFGMKGPLYPEYVLALVASKRLDRPVKWTSGRAEAFLSDSQGRDNVSKAALALDTEGRMLALRVDTIANLGGYLSSFAPYVPTYSATPMLVGVYTLQAVHARVRGVFTNTVPVDAYRGAGRPEAAYLVERIVDMAARELGFAPDEIRRRNFIPVSAMPYKTPLQQTYDSGDFARNMADAMRLADWAGARRRKGEAEALGRFRGIGMATYIESCGGGIDEMAELRVDPSGAVTLIVGSQANGQGHHTAFAQIVAERLGVPIESVRMVQGDTDLVPYGNGTGGSRALAVAGSAVLGAADKLQAKARRWAAFLMEAAEADIEFDDDRFRIAGTDRSITLAEIATASYRPRRLPDGLDFGLAERHNHMPRARTYPNGCHIAEVEVDPETGRVVVVNYVVVDDFGRVLNPLLLEGQVHGGTVQGIGQALFERCVYDPESGQLLTGTLTDYCLPRADDVPAIAFAFNEVPTPANPLGVKGAGEAGAIGAPPAIINALVDALAARGVTHIDMPATPERVWRALGGDAA